MGNQSILYFGERYPLRGPLQALRERGGFEILYELPESGRADVVIDNASVSPVDLRARMTALAGRFNHYILVSSCLVYPLNHRMRAWREDDIDVCADLFPSLPPAVGAARALERELILSAAARGFAYSIVRPAFLDAPELETGITRWLARRVVSNGLVVMPEGTLPIYRLIQSQELAEALATIAGQPKAFGATLNVANKAVLSYWGHAAVVRDALGLPLRFGYVSQWRWRNAGLALPMGDFGSAGFIEPSPLLADLGWRTGDPILDIHEVARRCRELDVPGTDPMVRLEGETLTRHEQDVLELPKQTYANVPKSTGTRHWMLRASTGTPAGLALERIAEPWNMPRPLLKVKALSLGAPEEMLLRGEYPQKGIRAIGHNAILEVLQGGETGLAAGTLAIPVAALGCGDAECPFCRNGTRGVLGIDSDGYGIGICTTPAQHLVPIPEGLERAALLADPLAALHSVLQAPLNEGEGDVWIVGRSIEALLAGWLAEDAGRPVVRADRRGWGHDQFPTAAVGDLLREVREGRRPAPTLAVDFTSCADTAWTVGSAMRVGSSLFLRSWPPGVPAGVHWHLLPAAAPNRASIEQAFALLQGWREFRDLEARVGPSIPLDFYWDAFLPTPFALAYLEDRS